MLPAVPTPVLKTPRNSQSVISAIPGKVVCLVAPNYFFMPSSSRALSNGATHVCLRPIVAEIIEDFGRNSVCKYWFSNEPTDFDINGFIQKSIKFSRIAFFILSNLAEM